MQSSHHVDFNSIRPVTPGEILYSSLEHSRLFEAYFDPAILGTTINEDGREILVYDEEQLIELAMERLRGDTDDPEDILWEDGAMLVSDGLEMALEAMGGWAPVVL